uniref:lysylphosphatidylglycerol synthase domain-containing protein n=1 Tax=Mucilaginibacter mali TaxID=2740462 RepID=UPI0037420EB6
MLNRSAKKTVSYLLKGGILVLAFLFIYHRLNNNHDLQQFETLIAGISRLKATIVMSLVFVLMLVNWLLEAAKWRYLAKRLAPVGLWQCIEAVFCGLTWAVFTPNRIGEYGGRVMFLPPRKRIHGVFAMAVGAFGQNVITNVLGAIAIVWFVLTFLHLNIWLNMGVVVLAITLMVVMLLFYFNIRWVVSLLDSVKFLKKFHRFFDIMGRYSFTEMLNIMGYCLARFAVFSFQYYLVIHLLIPSIPLYDVLLMVFVLFFVQSALPSLDLLDIGVRNFTASTLFAYVTNQNIAVMAAVTSIWLINLIIPAILGSVFVFKLRFFDNTL